MADVDPSEPCIAYLRQQGEVIRAETVRREAMAKRLGITVERLNRLLAASALRPDVGWGLSPHGLQGATDGR